jgi:hypothetical protein
MYIKYFGARFEVFTAVKIQVQVWVVTVYSVVVGYPEDRGSKFLQNVSNLPLTLHGVITQEILT